MVFMSFQFLFFFSIVVAAWFTAPPRYRSYVLLAASVWFYASWSLLFLWTLAVCIITAWGGGLLVDAAEGRKRTFYLIVSLLVPAGLLLFFKYYNFFADAASDIVQRLEGSFSPPFLQLALPVGISFFVFKTLSYLMDVHGKKLTPDNILNVANYIAFFPQILAGPIERAGNFLPQLGKKHEPDPARFHDGLALILWGLFKKAVIADNCAMIVDWVYASPQEFPGLVLIIATYCFAIQIYCDFSGYSDMAIGAAKILGFSTMRNFNQPYAAVSVGDFWRRWHISLSKWFRDYVYIPLGGSKVAVNRWMFNVMIVFLICGLWHGANWTFILWGALHGFFLIMERLLSAPMNVAMRALRFDRLSFVFKAMRVVLTFNLVTFAWIFFRANSIGDAYYIVTHLFNGVSLWTINMLRMEDLIVAFFGVGALIISWLLQGKSDSILGLRQRVRWVRWAVYAALVLAIINLRPLFQPEFIYIQF